MGEAGRKIVGVQVGSKEEPQRCFYEKDIMNIEVWRPKKNYSIPIFYTRSGTFTVLTTLEECAYVFPAFKPLDTWNLVNLKNGERLVTGDYGGRLYFRSSTVSTGVNQKSISMWGTLVAEAKNSMTEDSEIFVNPIAEDGKIGKGQFIKTCNVLYIDKWEAKKNYDVPRFYTNDGCFTAGLTFQSCTEAIPHFFPAYNGSLVNIDLIERIEDSLFGSTILFKDSDHTAGIANGRVKYLKAILNQRPSIP